MKLNFADPEPRNFNRTEFKRDTTMTQQQAGSNTTILFTPTWCYVRAQTDGGLWISQHTVPRRNSSDRHLQRHNINLTKMATEVCDHQKPWNANRSQREWNGVGLAAHVLNTWGVVYCPLPRLINEHRLQTAQDLFLRDLIQVSSEDRQFLYLNCTVRAICFNIQQSSAHFSFVCFVWFLE
jgi:hypothetical protein